MKLFSSRTSPFARKVRVVLHELQMFERVEEVFVDPFSNDTPSEFLAANPLSRIPTLITDQGVALPDSRLIIEWLQTEAPRPLPPASARWPAARRQMVADGVIEAAVATVLEKRRPESIVFPTFLDRQTRAITRAIDMLELEANALLSDAPGVVDISTAVALAYLDLRMPYLRWRTPAPTLAAWFEGFRQRPSMLATQPPEA